MRCRRSQSDRTRSPTSALQRKGHPTAVIDRPASKTLSNQVLLARVLRGLGADLITNCRIPCDHLPRRSWALFQAREVMRGVLESLTAKQPT